MMMVMINAVGGLDGIGEYLSGVGGWGKKRKHARGAGGGSTFCYVARTLCLKINPTHHPQALHTHTHSKRDF